MAHTKKEIKRDLQWEQVEITIERVLRYDETYRGPNISSSLSSTTPFSISNPLSSPAKLTTFSRDAKATGREKKKVKQSKERKRR